MYILVQRNIYIVSCSRGFLWTGCCRWIIFMSSYCGRICPGLLININSVFSLGGDLAVGGAHESWQFCIVVPSVVLLPWQRDLETVPFMGFAYQGVVSDTAKALLSVTQAFIALRIIYVSGKHHWGSQASFSKLPLCPCTVSGILGGQKLDVQWQQTQQQSSKSETPMHHVSEAFINLVVELSWTWECTSDWWICLMVYQHLVCSMIILSIISISISSLIISIVNNDISAT